MNVDEKKDDVYTPFGMETIKNSNDYIILKNFHCPYIYTYTGEGHFICYEDLLIYMFSDCDCFFYVKNSLFQIGVMILKQKKYLAI